MPESLDDVLQAVRACTLCRDLPLGPNPLLQASATARILVAGQAPGRITHHKGRPFDDPSGQRLRSWMGIDRETFYDPAQIAILAMAFCYPGTGKGGDMPPRPLCAATWRERLLTAMPDIRLTLLIGQYAQAWHLPDLRRESLTSRVRKVAGLGQVVPLPHPSPRNMMWLKANPWFEAEVLPRLRESVQDALR